ncbi:hypothetical protein JOY44_10760 [Phormidium sp. CLA17]|uniref:hypothetical protein n=1 Tax=Leptolyngbya sp. Cla-17 TaxID=2803751 RepID=UPI001490AB32|nr:hypothetical protein [Leptolyngbya sp. Cla-17]MBM0742096.1 hypothetical protein [Leptolyngbya sp. Cla-17]
MQKSLKVSVSKWSTLASRVGIALLGTSVTLSVAFEAQAAYSKPVAQAPAVPTATLPDGVYLYGQAPKPNELGKGYFVFENKAGKVVGALYMPSSSFDCAAGEFKANQLALMVTDSYDRTANPFEIALDRNSTIASSANPSLNLGLQGFHKLNAVSQNDLRLLNVCKLDSQKAQ